MSCCPYHIEQFFDTAFTVINYSDSMKSQFGAKPKVSVYYFDPPSGGWYTVNGIPGSVIHYDPVTSNISIDHGGIFTGYVKIQ